MRLLLDQGVGRLAVDLLRSEGFEVSHVADHGLSRALDAEILAFARSSSAVVVTLDHDFHRELALSGASSPSVVFIRDEHLKRAAVADLVAGLCRRYDEPLRAGAVLTTRNGLARFRLLPFRIAP